jgi:serine protease
MQRSRRRPVSVSILGLALLAGCGGGGGGGGVSRVRLEGTLTVPSLAAGRGRLVPDATLDDVAHQAQDAGCLTAGDGIALHGHVGGDDRRDVFQVRLPAGQTCAITASAGVHVEVFDAALGSCASVLAGDAPIALFAAHETAIDVVVAAAGASGVEYRVQLSLRADAAITARLPLTAGPEVHSTLQVGYLGADREMIAGEVIVQQDEATVAIASAEFAALGLVPTTQVPGPIQRYRVAAPVAPLARSAMTLELQTCLAAHRAARVAGVAAASPNYIYRAYQAMQTPNDRLFALQWHYNQIKAPQAWALFNGAPGSNAVIVSVVDTGMVLNHPDFAGRLTAGYDMISDPSRALDGNGIDNNPDDPGDGLGTGLPSSFHGTHVGGTVGAASNNSVGVAGMDWQCQLMPIRVLGRGGSGSLEDIAQGIRWAAGLSNASGTLPARRCDVMNMSLGGPGSASVLENACNAASGAGVLLVVAAGNDNSSTPNFPASYDVCLSVGSIRFDFARAPYSNFASTVDVNAPGGDTSVDQNRDGEPDGVLSCLAADGTPLQVGFGFLQGTSMACPHVAGVAALVKAKAPTASAAQVRTFITSNTFSQGGSTRIVDTFLAVQAAQGTAAPNPILAITPSNIGLRNSETTATVALSNIGNPALLTVVTPISTDINYTSTNGSNWITAVALEGTGTASISHPTLRVTVSRTGLADGEYTATVNVRSSTTNVAAAQLAVTLFVGTQTAPNDTVFVLVVDENTFDNLGQTQTTAATSFAYALPDVPTGRYYLVAGTDRDNDDFIGDEGELFGIWPSNDSPLVLEITGSNAVQSGLNFTLELQSVQQGVGGTRRSLPPLRLRR